MTVPDDRFARMRELASKATPGPWKFDGWFRVRSADGLVVAVCDPQTGEDCHYLAACDPATILALLNDRDAMRAQIEKLAWALGEELREQRKRAERAEAMHADMMHERSELGDRLTASAAARVRAETERDQLAAVVERVRDAVLQTDRDGMCMVAVCRIEKVLAEFDTKKVDENEALLPKERP